MSLLQLADITLHSGRRSSFKIECDALTSDDWRAVASMLVKVVPPFYAVRGVPRGGLPLERAMRYHTDRSTKVLVVDDVWTTGGSMVAYANEYFPDNRLNVIGAVLFARGPVDPWVTPLFTLHEGLWSE